MAQADKELVEELLLIDQTLLARNLISLILIINYRRKVLFRIVDFKMDQI